MSRRQFISELNKPFDSLLDSVAGLADDQKAAVWYVNDILVHEHYAAHEPAISHWRKSQAI